MSTESVENEEIDYYSLPVYRDLASTELETCPTCIRRAQEAAKFLDRVGLPEEVLKIMEERRMAAARAL